MYKLLNAVNQNNVEKVKFLMADPNNEDENNNDDFGFNACISIAAGVGFIEIVKLLLEDPRTNPDANLHITMALISATGNTSTLELFQEDKKKYPTYTIRKNNLPLDQKIKLLEEQSAEIYLLSQTTTENIIRIGLEIVYLNLQLEIKKIKDLKV